MTNNKDARPGQDWRDDDARDAGVTRVYRESAVERTPPQLDAAVLAAARRGARNRYALSVYWLRPMAWAATIGLCLAIVIDINTIPGDASGDYYRIVPSMEKEFASEAIREQSAATPESAAIRRQELPADASSVARPDRASGEVGAAMEPSAGLLQVEAAADDGVPALADEAPGEREKAALAVGAAAADIDNAPGEPAAAQAFRTTLRKAATACTVEERAEAERWLKCIDALEAEGRDDAADDERRRFELKYPDYSVD